MCDVGETHSGHSPLKVFENSSIEDLASLIPPPPEPLIGHIPIIGPPFKFFHELISGTPPEREKVLESLRRIAAQEGDPQRIDPGRETRDVAKFFDADTYRGLLPAGYEYTKADIEFYYTNYRLTFWDERRKDILKNYGLESKHRFSALSQICAQFYSTFRGLNSFEDLADLLPDMVPRIRAMRKLDVLYPGAGYHLAPLATAMSLIDRGIIDEATYTYTERTDYTLLSLEILTMLRDQGILDYADQGYLHDLYPKGMEREIIIVYKGHTIRIVYAWNRSGEDYYRDEYLKDADLVVIHDPGGGFFEDSMDLLAGMILDKRRAFPDTDQVVIMEGSAKYTSIGPAGNPLPEGVRQHELRGPYGHCAGEHDIGEVEHCAYETARVFLLNDPVLQSFASGYQYPFPLSRAMYRPPPRVHYAQPDQ